jgi:hypothetical protein
MKGYVHSIERAAQQNTTFRTVLYTAKNCQWSGVRHRCIVAMFASGT